jgi:hypothetical protein
MASQLQASVGDYRDKSPTATSIRAYMSVVTAPEDDAHPPEGATKMKNRLPKTLSTVTVVSRVARELLLIDRVGGSQSPTKAVRVALRLVGQSPAIRRTDPIFAACLAKPRQGP